MNDRQRLRQAARCIGLAPGGIARRQGRRIVRFVTIQGIRHPIVRRTAKFALWPFPKLSHLLLSVARSTQAANVPPTQLVQSFPATLLIEAAAVVKAHGAPVPLEYAERSTVNLGLIYYMIDETASFPSNTGIQRVVRQLARELMASGVKLIPVTWNRKHRQLQRANDADLRHLSQWSGPDPASWSDWIDPMVAVNNGWFLTAELPHNLPNADRELIVDSVTALGLRTCAVFYDCIPWKMREVYPSHFSLAHFEYLKSLGKMDLVLPISDFVACDLFAFLRGEGMKRTQLAHKIIPVHLPGEFPGEARHSDATVPRPCNSDQSAREIDGIEIKVDQQASKKKVMKIYKGREASVKILSVGTVEPRKNQLALVEAFKRAAEGASNAAELIIVGRRTMPELAEALEAACLTAPSVRWLEFVDDQELQDLYMSAAFTVFPSVEEGFGLPIIESLWFGKPCLCANYGAMKEVADGGGCHMVDVRDVDTLAAALALLIDDQDILARLSREAIARDLKGWTAYAEEVADRLRAHSFDARV